MPVSLLGVTEGFGLPPVKSAHNTVTVVGVAVMGSNFEGALQVPSYWLLPDGLQVPNVAATVAYLAYQAVVMVSSAVLTLK
jgi:phosphoribosylcarboxyaminoimidazole (NCAIR) mutase